jgi:RHS repeat-associated protein
LYSALLLNGMAWSAVPDKSGVKPSVLSLPSGPGSIEGLGKAFQPQINTGTATYGVSLKLPPGAAGFAPSVNLSYNSGAGNSPYGQGWNCSPFLTIERQTEKGFPHYRDNDSDSLRRDVFLFQGEELVPLSDGTYRCANETEFRRFTPFRATGSAVDSWLVEDRNGTKRWLGRYLNNSPSGSSSRVVHPAPPLDGGGARSPFEETFLWCEDAAEDVNGNRIEFEYLTDFASPGMLYLDQIRYFARDNTANHHLLTFYYQSRPDKLPDNRSGFSRVTALRCREIAITSVYGGTSHPIRSYVISYRPDDGALGDIDAGAPAAEMRLNLGLSFIHAITQVDSQRTPGGLGSPGNPLPPMRFAYSGFYLGPPATEAVAALSPLRHRLRQGETDPLMLGPQTGALIQKPDPDHGASVSLHFDARPENAAVQFADMNGDGLPDLLNTETDQNNPRFRVAWNMGNRIFKTSEPVTSSPVLINLANNGPQSVVTLNDADGDGIADLVHIVDAGGLMTRVYANRFSPDRADGPNGFAAAPAHPDAPTPLDLSLSAPNVRQMDVDFDKRPDVLVSSEQGITIYRSERNGGWSNLGRQDWSTASGDGRIPRDYEFSRTDMDAEGTERSNPLVHLADMNGDRLLDLVRISIPQDGKAVVSYLPLVEATRWGQPVTFAFALADGSPLGSAATLDFPANALLGDPGNPQNGWESLQLLDVNGDGLTDLGMVLQNQTVIVYFNCHGTAVRGPFTMNNTPRYQPYDQANPTILRTLDINGNGSTDLVFYHAAGDNNLVGFRYLEFISGQKPGLLQVIDNGIGRRTFIRYRSATDDLMRARKAGHPWLTTMPNPVWVVAGMVDDIGLDLNGDGETDKYATSFDYRDGYYDGFEKQFRGFAYAQKTSWGDDVATNGLPTGLGLGQVSAPTAVTRYRFMTGSADGADNDEYIPGFDTEPRPPALAVDETTEWGGREEEALKGKAVWEEVVDGAALVDATADFDLCAAATALAARSGDPYAGAASRATPDRYLYSRTHSRWAIRRLYRPEGVVACKGRLLPDEPGNFALVEKSVSFPILTEVTTEVIEANEWLRTRFSIENAPVAQHGPVITRKSTDYDNFGNTVLERDEGVISALSPPPDDERVIRRQFILTRGPTGSIAKWIIDRVQSERVEDENGVFVRETRDFYDGLAFTGLPLGQIGDRGLETRVQQRVKDSAFPAVALEQLPTAAGGIDALLVSGDPRSSVPEWIDAIRKAYDQYGNVTFIMDPLGQAAGGAADPGKGHVRQLTYDSVYHTFPVEERIHVGDGKADLVMRAEYQRAATATGSEAPWGFGVMTRSTDFNGNHTDYFYDSFARLAALVKPGDSEALPTLLFGYRPADPHRGLRYHYHRAGGLEQRSIPSPTAANAVQTDARELADQPGVFTTLSYTDGNANKLLTLEEDETPGLFVVKEATRYNLRGAAKSNFQPYRQTGSGFALPEPTAPRSDFFADAMGRVIRTVLPPETVADPGDRRETRTHYLPITEYTFDEEDIASSNPAQPHLNTPMVHYKDGLGRLIGVDETVRNAGDGNGAGPLQVWPTRYRYDLNDNLVHILDSQANQKWFRYDGLGRKIFMNDPNRGVMFYSYDDASNLRETLDAKSQRITYTYDGVNRLHTEKYHDGQPAPPWRSDSPLPGGEGSGVRASFTNSVVYHYDTPYANLPQGNNTLATGNNTKGFLSWVEDLSGEEHTSYDTRSRVEYVIKRIPDPQFLSILDGSPFPSDGRGGRGEGLLVSYKTAFTYDSLDRLTRLTYPDNDEITHHYNARSLLQRIPGGPTGSILSNITYRASAQLERIEYGNGVRTTYAYDPRLRLRNLHTLSTTGGVGGDEMELIHFNYDSDGANNITAIHDRRPGSAAPAADPRRNTQLFRYDDLYRLTRAQYSFELPGQPERHDGVINYRYDRIGNMLAQTSDIAHFEKGLSVTQLGDMSYGATGGRFGRIGRTTANPGPHALTFVSQLSTNTPAPRIYPYDANGNMTLLDGLQCTWDFKDRLIAVENATMRAEYTYDFTERRIIKRVFPKHSLAPTGGEGQGEGARLTSVLYPDRYFEVREHDAPTKYVWNGNTRVARVTGSLSANLRVQRLRLSPGWNLCSIAIGSPSPLWGEGRGEVLSAAFCWNPVTLGWDEVLSSDSLPAGTVLWLHAHTNAAIAITGTYSEPTNCTISANGDFLPGAGLEVWNLQPALTHMPSAIAAIYDAKDARWLSWLPPLGLPAAPPALIAPGEAGFVRTDSSGTLEVAEASLRIRYYHQDHLGSCSVLADSAGLIASESAHYAFGYRRFSLRAMNLVEPYQYTQKETDTESTFAYFDARFHVAALGRFASADPADDTVRKQWLTTPQRWNPFSYAVNMPISFIDPAGLDAIPIVFPNYKIQTPVGRIGGLGHAGVLLIDPKSGQTKYYEYGRYDNEGRGLVRGYSPGKVEFGKDGKPTPKSLDSVLKTISHKSGHKGEISGAYVKDADFQKMVRYAEGRKEQNKNPERREYSILRNNCGTFMKDVVEAGGASMPSMIDPRPNSYIGEVRDTYPAVDFKPRTAKSN